ncbi:hypothetical protein [Streptomyces californicus]
MPGPPTALNWSMGLDGAGPRTSVCVRVGELAENEGEKGASADR